VVPALAEDLRLARYPGTLLQTSPPGPPSAGAIGRYELIDLDLSRYDQIAARFAREQQESTTFLESGINTRNAVLNRMIEHIERAARRRAATASSDRAHGIAERRSLRTAGSIRSPATGSGDRCVPHFQEWS
jgi:sigma54-dependent transcription regulator